MSTRYRKSEDVPTATLVSRLLQLVKAVTKTNWNEFDMRIPVELDRDADVVMYEVAARLNKLDKQAHQVWLPSGWKVRRLTRSDDPICITGPTGCERVVTLMDGAEVYGLLDAMLGPLKELP